MKKLCEGNDGNKRPFSEKSKPTVDPLEDTSGGQSYSYKVTPLRN
jgi:hypothetical protein